jgi:hypothetical protein
MIPHHWFTPSVKGSCGKWLTYCARCGLVALKNEVTQRAIKAGCWDGKDVEN